MLVWNEVRRTGKGVSAERPGDRSRRVATSAAALIAGLLTLGWVPAGAAPPPGVPAPPDAGAAAPGGPFAEFEFELAFGRYIIDCTSRQGVQDLVVDDDGNAVVAGFSRRFCTRAMPPEIDVHEVLPDGAFGAVLSPINTVQTDFANGVALDGQGNVYITGFTEADLTRVPFPVVDPFQGDNAGGADAFVMKLDPTLRTILYATFLGGSGNDLGTDIAVDDEGRIVVLGTTESADFPTKAPLQEELAGGQDVFVTVFEPDGSELAFSSYFGGAENERTKRVAVLGDRIHFTGSTSSPDLPTRVPGRGGVLASVYGGGPSDAFVARIDRFRRLGFAGFLGGSGKDVGYGLALDRSGSAFITGTTDSTDFPTARALQENLADPSEADAFLVQLTPSGSRARFSTYLDVAGSAQCRAPSSGTTFCTAVALAESGTAFVAANGFPAIAVSKNPRRILARFALPLESTSIGVSPDGSVYVGGATLGFSLPFIDARIPPPFFLSEGGWVIRLTREPE